MASRLTRRFTPRFVRRSYLAKFGAALFVVVLCIGVVGAGTYVQTSEQLRGQVDAFEANADGDKPDADGESPTQPTRADGFEWPNAN